MEHLPSTSLAGWCRFFRWENVWQEHLNHVGLSQTDLMTTHIISLATVLSLANGVFKLSQ